jgi:hypothetical protein
MKVLRVAAVVVGVAAGILATAATFGAGGIAAAGLLGASWGGIAAAAGIVSAGLNLISPARPKSGSYVGATTDWKLIGASP